MVRLASNTSGVFIGGVWVFIFVILESTIWFFAYIIIKTKTADYMDIFVLKLSFIDRILAFLGAVAANREWEKN